MGKNRKRISLKLSDNKKDSVKRLDFMILDEKTSGETYLVPAASLMGKSGFHLSFHKSGEKHAKADNPNLKALLPDEKQLITNITKVFPKLIKLPKRNENVVLQVVDLKGNANIKVEETKHNVNIDAYSAFKVAMDTPMYSINTNDFESAIEELKTTGVLTKGKAVFIFQENSNCMGYYVPLDDEQLKSEQFPEWFPKECITTMLTVKGFVVTFYKDEFKQLLSDMLYPYGKEWIEILEGVAKTVKDDPGIRELDEKLKSLAASFNPEKHKN